MNTFIDAGIPVILGFVLLKVLALWKRDKDSRNTPWHFSPSFWLHDNWISIVFHGALVLTIILYGKDFVDFVTGYEHTPKQVAAFFKAVPNKIIMFCGGLVSAMPMSWFEKQLRDLKKRLKLMKVK